jgi:hypothetical protein
MATYNKFDTFVYDLGIEKHNLGSDKIHIYLTPNAPSNTADFIRSDCAPLANGNGYNQTEIFANWANATGTATLTANNDITWTANGNFGPFQYVVMLNANSDANANNCALIGWWNYGSAINCNNGESFTVDFPANKVVFSIT